MGTAISCCYAEIFPVLLDIADGCRASTARFISGFQRLPAAVATSHCIASWAPDSETMASAQMQLDRPNAARPTKCSKTG
jgi:hypothetical protein